LIHTFAAATAACECDEQQLPAPAAPEPFARRRLGSFDDDDDAQPGTAPLPQPPPERGPRAGAALCDFDGAASAGSGGDDDGMCGGAGEAPLAPFQIALGSFPVDWQAAFDAADEDAASRGSNFGSIFTAWAPRAGCCALDHARLERSRANPRGTSHLCNPPGLRGRSSPLADPLQGSEAFYFLRLFTL
jgi:hypothetical protein